jgi:hypothetical protein
MQLWKIWTPDVKIDSAWGTVAENKKISTKVSLAYCELRKYRPWFDEGCSKLLDQRKQVTKITGCK